MADIKTLAEEAKAAARKHAPNARAIIESIDTLSEAKQEGAAGFWLAPMEPDDDMLAAMGMVGHINEFWPAMRDSYLARNPGACSVTDGEAKK